ncbi:MAG: hypothetical protein EU531_07875 [Promethearchaeota archaeon]|nr:MAG: hypothetical protein EU531_07875 [Candidatus Lokiarchaeota archaeon]
MNYCPYCGFNLQKYKTPNFCSHCGRKLRKKPNYSPNRMQCGICHKYVELDDDCISCSFCGGKFHKYCVSRWILQYNACPICQNIYVIPNS